MFLAIAVLSESCAPVTADALTPYFEGTIEQRPDLTPTTPCPIGSHIVERRDTVVTCGVATAPDDTLEITFDPDGRVASYVTRARGVRSGTGMRWLDDGGTDKATWRRDVMHGRRIVRDARGELVREETYVDGILDGPAQDHRDTGAYVAGVRTGAWTEWRANRRAEGRYVDGLRTGDWELTEGAEPKLSPDFVVHFEPGEPVRAERTVGRYHGLMLGFDAALLGIAIAFRRAPVAVATAWPQIGMIPMRSGGGIGVSGAF